jgi:hypothetical protein
MDRRLAACTDSIVANIGQAIMLNTNGAQDKFVEAIHSFTQASPSP